MGKGPGMGAGGGGTPAQKGEEEGGGGGRLGAIGGRGAGGLE